MPTCSSELPAPPGQVHSWRQRAEEEEGRFLSKLCALPGAPITSRTQRRCPLVAASPHATPTATRPTTGVRVTTSSVSSRNLCGHESLECIIRASCLSSKARVSAWALLSPRVTPAQLAVSRLSSCQNKCIGRSTCCKQPYELLGRNCLRDVLPRASCCRLLGGFKLIHLDAFGSSTAGAFLRAFTASARNG